MVEEHRDRHASLEMLPVKRKLGPFIIDRLGLQKKKKRNKKKKKKKKKKREAPRKRKQKEKQKTEKNKRILSVPDHKKVYKQFILCKAAFLPKCY